MYAVFEYVGDKVYAVFGYAGLQCVCCVGIGRLTRCMLFSETQPDKVYAVFGYVS